ncbi:MAG: hypothetical protein AAFZ92_07555 [Pseudomonadota bacterium]
MRTSIIQEKLQFACPHVDITAFGRVRDFRKQVTTSQPAAILSPSVVIERTQGYSLALHGVHNDQTEEAYVLAAFGEPIDTNKITEKVIGVVDILGRKPMVDYTSQLLQAQVKIKRVAKQEDLLPLLTFGAIDGVLVSSRTFAAMQQQSNQILVATELNITVGLVAAGVTDASAQQPISQCLSSLDTSMNELLGVEKWR